LFQNWVLIFAHLRPVVPFQFEQAVRCELCSIAITYWPPWLNPLSARVGVKTMCVGCGVRRALWYTRSFVETRQNWCHRRTHRYSRQLITIINAHVLKLKRILRIQIRADKARRCCRAGFQLACFLDGSSLRCGGSPIL